MAALFLRLRRALALSSPLLQRSPLSAGPTSPLLRPRAATAFLQKPSLCSRPHSLALSRSLHSSAVSADRRSDVGGGGESKIGPDEILFEGCDYNHWLITMDFPKDPKPTPEEMVETYVQTAAKVVGSVEEAKKRIYACSTTTYQGFQLVCDEDTSEKFRGLPGVVFILPDSYIDPVNKQYGGDKYDNGVITPRPPPIQYGRQGRYGDRNRNYDRPRYDRPRDSMPMQQGNQPFGHQGPMQGPQQNYGPEQKYGPPGQDGRGYGPPPQQPPAPGGRNYAPQQNYGPEQKYGPPGQDGRGYGPPPQQPPAPGGRNYAPQQNYGPPPSGNFATGRRDGYQGEWRDPMPPYQQGFSQGGGNFAPQEHTEFSQRQGGPHRNVGPSGAGDYRQGTGPGYSGEYRQGPESGDNSQGGPNYGAGYQQGSGSGYSQSYAGPAEGQTESWQGRN